jgi:hypothetical protein
MTFGYLRTQYEAIGKGLTEFSRWGLRSYQPGTCGLHVHISKTAFTGLHLYRFLKMFYENPVFTMKIAQRRGSDAERWASLTTENHSALIRKAKDGHDQVSRYVAVNTENGKTVEVRIYRGTLKTSSMLKSLEHAMAAYEYTKTCGMGECTSTAFVKWVGRNSKRYSFLQEWLEENWIGKSADELGLRPGYFGLRPNTEEEL